MLGVAATVAVGALAIAHVREWNDPTNTAIRRLGSSDPRVRAEAARALGEVGPRAFDRALGALVDVHAEPSKAVRLAVHRATARLLARYPRRLRPQDRETLLAGVEPGLAVRLADETTDEATRIALVHELAGVERVAGMDMALAAWKHAITAPSDRLREAAAAEAAGFALHGSAPVVSFLTMHLWDRSPRVRAAAAESLERLPRIDPAAARPLLVVVDDDDVAPAFRRAAVLALGALRPPPPEVVDRLVAILDDARSPLRAAAAAALERVGPTCAAPARPALTRASADPDPALHDAARRALTALDQTTTRRKPPG